MIWFCTCRIWKIGFTYIYIIYTYMCVYMYIHLAMICL
jgi:hypothetical protein